LLLAVPVAAGAQPPPGGDDEVTLRNGGMLRGTVVSVEPGRELAIVVQGSSEVRHIPWAQVDQVNRGKFRAQAAPPAPPPPPGPPMAPPSAYAPTPVTPHVHIQSDAPELQLHEVMAQVTGVVWGGGWATLTASRPVCTAPCDQIIDAHQGQSFFVAGPGIPKSSQFQLAGRGPEVNLDVKAGSTGLRVGGIVVTGIGGAAIAIGIALLAVGFTAPTDTIDANGNLVTTQGNQSFQIAGGVTLGLGVGALVGGIVMIVQGGTKYQFLAPGQQSARGLGFTF
jgi:hypothetical protein